MYMYTSVMQIHCTTDLLTATELQYQVQYLHCGDRFNKLRVILQMGIYIVYVFKL